jgi:hypothetical protein
LADCWLINVVVFLTGEILLERAKVAGITGEFLTPQANLHSIVLEFILSITVSRTESHAQCHLHRGGLGPAEGEAVPWKNGSAREYSKRWWNRPEITFGMA